MKKFKYIKTFEKYSERNNNEYDEIASIIASSLPIEFEEKEYYLEGEYVMDLIFNEEDVNNNIDKNKIFTKVKLAMEWGNYTEEYDINSFWKDNKLVIRIKDK